MRRRTFLKAVGLAIAAPGAVLGAVKASPHNIPAIPPFTTIAELWAQTLFDFVMEESKFQKFLVGDYWVPPLKGTNKPLVINRIHPK